ncbi:hypothetical protein AS034_17930 [[Bacillus] enclensis]|nr:hypothetical protein AS034_17930 [[Bacillus] enclensis]
MEGRAFSWLKARPFLFVFFKKDKISIWKSGWAGSFVISGIELKIAVGPLLNNCAGIQIIAQLSKLLRLFHHNCATFTIIAPTPLAAGMIPVSTYYLIY